MEDKKLKIIESLGNDFIDLCKIKGLTTFEILGMLESMKLAITMSALQGFGDK
jgi:hypothetical protein